MDVICQISASESFDAEDPDPEKESRGGQWAGSFGCFFWGESEVLVPDLFFFFFFLVQSKRLIKGEGVQVDIPSFPFVSPPSFLISPLEQCLFDFWNPLGGLYFHFSNSLLCFRHGVSHWLP